MSFAVRGMGQAGGMKIASLSTYARSAGVLGGMRGRRWEPSSVVNVKLVSLTRGSSWRLRARDRSLHRAMAGLGGPAKASEAKRDPILQRAVVACRPCARLREAMVAGGCTKDGRA